MGCLFSRHEKPEDEQVRKDMEAYEDLPEFGLFF